MKQLFGPAASLRRRIMLVAAAGILPVAIAAAAGLWALVREVERSADAKTLEVTRIAATAIQVELQQSIASLRSLSFSLPPDEGNLDRYEVLLKRFIAEMPGWSTLLLATPDQRVLINTAIPAGQAPPPIVDTRSFEQTVRERKPVIGSLLMRADGSWGIAVRLPILRRGELLYVLTAVLTPEAVLKLVGAQTLPGNWIMSVFDANGSRVARTHDHQKFLGTAAAPTLLALMKGDRPHGTGITRTLEGTEVFTAFVRLPENGWSVAVGIPTVAVLASARTAFALYGSGILLSILLAFFVAAYAARGITEPIAVLREGAERMGRGERPIAPVTPIDELSVLGRAMVNAAEARGAIEAERIAVVEQLKVAAEERRQLLESERAARTEAVRMSQIKDQFLATLSHELRTPLNSILGWSQILAQGKPGDAERRQGLEIIERNARAQARLIEDLLDMSRITSGKIHLDMMLLQPALLVERALEVARPQAEAKRLRFTKDIDPDAGQVMGDQARLQQVIGNLLSNAIKFTPAGGNIQVRVQRSGSSVEICVSDDGQGIEAEFLPHIFERFRQADASTTRRFGGLGLGLSIVRDLVAMHRGSVSAQSAGPGKGATFNVRLPTSGAGALVPLAVPVPSEFDADLSGLRIVVIDDEADTRNLTARVLGDCGADVFATANAADALQALQSQQRDVLVSDIGMPDMDGYSLLREVRALGVRGQVPAIALTAYARAEDRARAIRAGFAVHVTKPIEPSELIATVAGITGRTRRDGAHPPSAEFHPET